MEKKMNVKITTVLNWLAALHISIGILLLCVFGLNPSSGVVFDIFLIITLLMLVIILINLILALCWKRYMGAVIAFVLFLPFVCAVVGFVILAIAMVSGHGRCGPH